MRRHGLEAYLVPSTDPHQSEYTPSCWQRRQWLSGFTGSVGELVVTLDEALLWTDSRYFLQAEQQLARTGIALQRLGVPGVKDPREWLATALRKGARVGFDPELLSMSTLDELRAALERAGARPKPLGQNLVDALWADRPERPAGPLRTHALAHAGETAAHKLLALRAEMGERGAQAMVVARLESVAWLFNVRGEDVAFTPVAVAYALVEMDRATLFVDRVKVPAEVARHLAGLAEVRPYRAVAAALRALARRGATVWVDPAAANASIGRALEGARLLRAPSPVLRMKARKNRVEQLGARRAHLRDGLAMVRFLAWLERAVPRGGVTELGAAARLEAFRREGALYEGPSFATISASGPHGAIVHYAPSPESDRRLAPGEVYLVDSGGQYRDGTTDITRTVLLGGRASAELRDRFTRVLRGHVAIARCRFPAGTTGQRIDALARTALWEAGLDYGHGTGHGVGSFLSVHEPPVSIAPARWRAAPLEAGNVVSNEPGYYRTGRYGIRTESLMLVTRDRRLSRPGRSFLGFETLSLCPIDRRLVEPRALSERERAWLDGYHAEVLGRLGPELDGAALRWLRRATRPL